MTRDDLVLKWFRKPVLYDSITDDEWRGAVDDALVYGCDWLAVLQRFNPVPAAAVEELCERCEKMEQEIATLKKVLDTRRET